MQPSAFLRSVLVALCLGPLAAWAVNKGQPAPDFSLAGAKGQVTLSDYKGKVVYVDFWASWCAPCRLSFPFLNEMLAKYESQGLRIVGINVDKKAADAAKFLQKVPA